jgi:hypothetical protein
MEPLSGSPHDDPVDRLVIQLRAYVPGKRRTEYQGDRPSKISVIFDTETWTDPSQRLRFGAYQVRDHGELIERGLFHAEDTPADDLAVLRAAFAEDEPSDAGERLRLCTRAEFVEEVFFGWGYELGARIIGFNLPFDLSRIAVDHTYAKRAMKGGFSFSLAEGRPNVRVKHLSQRAAFIDFAGKRGDRMDAERGFFIDVKTLAAALTSASHSLASLSKLLGVTPKSPLDDYSGPLTHEKIHYGMNDVQATWDCYAKLAEKFAAYQLADADVRDLYSEASLGKAFLHAMHVRPWREMQPTFPPSLIGQIMSTYYGGRAEVHIRREITPVIHCDFLSMYPTVCTLMGLWRFVIAGGVEWRDATEDVRAFVDRCSATALQQPETWRELHAIVQVLPDGDIFPVRAHYGGSEGASIGVNYLSADEPMWFTLADVLAAKLLGGKTPRIVSAIRFSPLPIQSDLKPISLEGTRIDPAEDDFYRLLIVQRRRVREAEKSASGSEKAALASAQQSLKILANATSYGIFVELNVQQLENSRRATCFDHRGAGRPIRIRRREDAGRYFHPLLGALITGAARLMLALAEHRALAEGLDWSFCDTDSLAIANTGVLPQSEFIRRVLSVSDWFEPLNPYEVKGTILQLEKYNYPPDRRGYPEMLRPTNCLAVSAKRYVLFDRGDDGEPVIRKASAHGLGYLIAPYPDPYRGERIADIGAELWQEDLWREIIRATDAGKPDEVNFDTLSNFGQAAASRYAATNQTLLKWFDRYNASVPAHARVWPFNFLLSFQAKSRVEMEVIDHEAMETPAWRRRTPHPASRYSSDLVRDRPEVFDRTTSETVPWAWLKTYARTLARHHMHPELKFRGGDYDQRGALRRRHVHAVAALPIGKEADNLEEREFLGSEDEDSNELPAAWRDRRRIAESIAETQRSAGFSDRFLIDRARVSHHTLAAMRRGGRVSMSALLSLLNAAGELNAEAEGEQLAAKSAVTLLQRLSEDLGSIAAVANRLGLTRQYLGRVLRGEKPMTEQLSRRLETLEQTPPTAAADPMTVGLAGSERDRRLPRHRP